jgi:hypothetical protein
MKRVISISDLTIDLGNIKNIRIEPYSGGYGGCYVIIELLRGREYVFNPETEETKLIEPIIKQGFGSTDSAYSFVEEIEGAWNNYLATLEEPNL